MARRLRWIVAAAALLLPWSEASGDALCNYDDVTRFGEYIRKGKEAEKAGRPLDALLYFKASDEFCANSNEPRKGIMRIGARFGAKSASKGNLHTGEGIFKRVPDAHCRRWARSYQVPNPYEPAVPGICVNAMGGLKIALNESAGAFDWYEATYNRHEADLMMIRRLSANPGDIALYESVLAHFKARKELSGNDYSINPAHIVELERVAAANLDVVLSKEEKEFYQSMSASKSLDALDSALKWAAFMGGAARERVLVRAAQRGDEMLRASTPNAILGAIGYYEFAGQEKLRLSALARADDLGTAAVKAADPALALRYFTISGNERMVRKMKPLAEEAERKKAADMGERSGSPM